MATTTYALPAGGCVNGSPVSTAVSTAGAGTWTGTTIAGGVITRTGPVAAYTDTTDTAVNIIGACPNAQIGQGWLLCVLNGVAFLDTIAAGTGVTLTGTVNIAASAVRLYLVTITSATTVTIQGLGALTA